MKKLLALTASTLLPILPAFTDQTLTDRDVGISIDVPDDWTHDQADQFGYAIRPKAEQKEKIRIHLTAHNGVSPEKAIDLGAAKVNEIRARRGLPPEKILSQKPIKTKSGLVGEAAEIAQSGEKSYLTRIYIQRPDGTIFCVCIYHYGNMKFAKEAKSRILGSIRIGT